MRRRAPFCPTCPLWQCIVPRLGTQSENKVATRLPSLWRRSAILLERIVGVHQHLLGQKSSYLYVWRDGQGAIALSTHSKRYHINLTLLNCSIQYSPYLRTGHIPFLSPATTLFACPICQEEFLHNSSSYLRWYSLRSPLMSTL